jgi:hypothetical protein
VKSASETIWEGGEVVQEEEKEVAKEEEWSIWLQSIELLLPENVLE